jgi:hypothetical protein
MKSHLVTVETRGDEENGVLARRVPLVPGDRALERDGRN